MHEQLGDGDRQYFSTDQDIWMPIVYVFLVNHCSAPFIKIFSRKKNKAASELHGDLASIE